MLNNLFSFNTAVPAGGISEKQLSTSSVWLNISAASVATELKAGWTFKGGNTLFKNTLFSISLILCFIDVSPEKCNKLGGVETSLDHMQSRCTTLKKKYELWVNMPTFYPDKPFPSPEIQAYHMKSITLCKKSRDHYDLCIVISSCFIMFVSWALHKNGLNTTTRGSPLLIKGNFSSNTDSC